MQDIVERFSTHLKNVLTRALCFVVENNQSTILPEHLLWALGTEKGCLGAELLHKMNVPLERLRLLVAATKMENGEVAPGSPLTPSLSDNAKRAVEKAVLSANVYEHRYVGTEHLLTGLLQIHDATVESFFTHERVDTKELKQHIALVLKSTSKFPEMTDAVGEERGMITKEKNKPISEETQPASKTPALDFFGRHLTSKEIQENVDPVIGREAEIERVMEILCRRTKNNPLLLGEPGVGKTAIVEGLAKRILEGTVPPALQNRRIVALDLALLIAGTMYRGEFEGRLRQIIDEGKKNSNLILFIDEIHTIVGAGAASGSLDAANILKPALARGEIRCIGATTQNEFKKHIEIDRALERRFQTVMVEEPTPEKTLEILHGVAPHYERYHGVRITESALENAIHLSNKYLPDKRLPDKALDLVDEAAAAVRVHATPPGPIEQRHSLEAELARQREAKRQAVVEERFEDALALKHEEEHIQNQLKSLEHLQEPLPIITNHEVAEVVARMCRLSLEEILSQEQQTLEAMEATLRRQIFGQDEAVQTVARAVRRAKMGLSDPRRPLASFLFLGPSGVGKTECARLLSDIVFQDPKALIRLDMSEYSEPFTISKLVGAPAGYIGYREQAKLTDRVKQRPASVVLFDELEKAHPDVQNLLLQILEEGELADATGRSVHFKNTVIVITSNVGLEKFAGSGLGFTTNEASRSLILTDDIRRELQERFRPELLNRIDQTILFQLLTPNALEAIAAHQLAEVACRLETRGIHLTWTKTSPAKISERTHARGGARDIRRLVQTLVEDPLAECLSRSPKASSFHLHTKDDELVLSPS